MRIGRLRSAFKRQLRFKCVFDFANLGCREAEFSRANDAGDLLWVAKTHDRPSHGGMVKGPCDRHLSGSTAVSAADGAQEFHEPQITRERRFPETWQIAAPVLG